MLDDFWMLESAEIVPIVGTLVILFSVIFSTVLTIFVQIVLDLLIIRHRVEDFDTLRHFTNFGINWPFCVTNRPLTSDQSSLDTFSTSFAAIRESTYSPFAAFPVARFPFGWFLDTFTG